VGVEGGPEQDADAVLLDLVPHGAADALDEAHVPGRREESLDGERRAVVRARRVALPLRLDSEAGRAIRDDDRGDPQAGDGDRRPRGTGDALRRLADGRSLPVRGRPGRRIPVPITRLTFSSLVIAAMTSRVGSCRAAAGRPRTPRRRPPPEGPAPEAWIRDVPGPSHPPFDRPNATTDRPRTGGAPDVGRRACPQASQVTDSGDKAGRLGSHTLHPWCMDFRQGEAYLWGEARDTSGQCRAWRDRALPSRRRPGG